MIGHARNLIIGFILMLPNAHAADLYLQQKDVTKSNFFTGTTGSAKAKPLTSMKWLEAHSGATAELAIRNYGFVIEDEQLNQLIYNIADRLLAHWPGTVPAFAIFVQGDRSPLLYSAATTYSREIFINYGVFLHAESEDELAAIIGHELAHVLLEHGKMLAIKKNMEKSLNITGQARDVYAVADSLHYDSATAEVSIDPSLTSSLKRSAVQQVVADKLYTSVHATFFSRGNEHDADKLALDLMIAAGYSPMGLKISLERMAHSYDLSTEISTYFNDSATLLLMETLAAIGQYMTDNAFRSQELDEFMQNAQNEAKDSMLDFGKKTLLEYTSRTHPVPDKRVTQMTTYLYDSYPRSVRRRQPDMESAERFRRGHISDLINHYGAANLAVEAIGDGDIAIAEQLSTEALVSPTADDPYTRYIAFFTSRSKGDKPAAVANIEGINPEELIPIFASSELADFLADSGKFVEAGEMMVRYEGYYGTINDYYPPKIKLSAATKDSPNVERLAHACYEVAPEASPLAKSCARASGIGRPALKKKTAFKKSVKNIGKFFRGDK
jgi:predicted Zn-dependent protease